MKGIFLQLEDDVHRALKLRAASLNVSMRGLAESILTSKLTGKKVIPEGAVKVAPTLEEKLIERIKSAPHQIGMKRDLQRSLNIDASKLHEVAKKLGLVEVSPFRGKMQAYVLPTAAAVSQVPEEKLLKLRAAVLNRLTSTPFHERKLIAEVSEAMHCTARDVEYTLKVLEQSHQIRFVDTGMDSTKWGYVKA